MKRFGIITDVIIGLLLIGSFFATGSYGVNAANKASYERALDTQMAVDKLGFDSFKLDEYPVAFYQSGKEYVFFNGEVSSRAPILGAMVGTTYLVDGHYEVFVPDTQDTALFSGLVAGTKPI